MTTLVIANHDNAELHASTLNTVTAAVQIGVDIHVLVAGSGAATVAAEAAKITGVAKVLHADADQYKDGVSVEVANLVVSLAGDYSHILAGSTTSGKEENRRMSITCFAAKTTKSSTLMFQNNDAGELLLKATPGEPLPAKRSRVGNYMLAKGGKYAFVVGWNTLPYTPSFA